MSHHFSLIKEDQIPELRSIARLYRHDTTGARLLSIINQDENKCFSINFRTPPQDSTGVAHVLEHSVLNGSQKYPVKEPFVELLKGSLATFINAITYPDKTCYPVASQNLHDFYNLIDVYMDAALHPLISPMTLQQEGWHYEVEDVNDPLTFKGVVFNEMKGAYSSPERVQEQEILTALFQDHTYGLSSGGAPEHIPDLSYEQFKRFHETWYHPSNAFIFFYGDDDPEARLELMEGYLASYQKIEVDSRIAAVTPLNKAVAVEKPFDAGQDATQGNKCYFTINWVFPDHSDPVLFFSLKVLAHILIGTPASPLRKALIDSGLGEDLTGLGLEVNEHRELLFSTGLKGIANNAAPQVEKLIISSLDKLVGEGIDEGMIEAALNTLEFQLRENNTGAFPQGLAIMERVMTTWLYDQDPLIPIAFEKPFNTIRKELKNDPYYFEDLIRKYLLDNAFRADLLLVPDGKLAKDREDQEKARLETIRSGLSKADLQTLVDRTKALKLRQETPDSAEVLATLPVLKLEDLERQVKSIPIEKETLCGIEVIKHNLFSNGIVYLDLGFDLGTLPDELLPLVPIFGQALLEMGTETEDYIKLSQRIGRCTGGIEVRPICINSYQTGQGITKLFLRTKATLERSGDMLEILKDILLTARLDNPERFKQIVLEQKSGIEVQLTMDGDLFAYKRVNAQFTSAGWAAEQIEGVTTLFFLRKLVEEIDHDWKTVLTRLDQMRHLLITRQGLICNVTMDTTAWKDFSARLDRLINELPNEALSAQKWDLQRSGKKEGLAIPSQVNYVGQAASLYSAGYQLDGSVEVINKYLRMAYLWEKVRVQGGAYGGYSVFDRNSGVLTFLSFRDPNVASTLKAYTDAVQFLKGLSPDRLSKEELVKGIIGAIGVLDAYQLPVAKGFTSMLRQLSGETDEKRQIYREQVLTTDLADFNAFGMVLEKAIRASAVVAVGSKTALEKEKLDLLITTVL